MTAVNAQPTAEVRVGVSAMTRVGEALARYGLVVVIGWIGLLKFTSYEAQGIEPLVANSPLLSWVYEVFSVTAFSTLLGVVEVSTAVLLAVKPWSPRISVVGSVMAVGLFLATISFLATTPGVGEDARGRIPVAVDDGPVPRQGRRAARHRGVDARRCAARRAGHQPGLIPPNGYDHDRRDTRSGG